MLRVDIKLRLDFNQLPLKMQKRSFHVLLINKTRLNSTLTTTGNQTQVAYMVA